MATAVFVPEVNPVKPRGKYRFDIVTADWNPEITDALRIGAIDTLRLAGIADENIHDWRVPGTVELVNAAASIMKNTATDGVIVLGCVIRGDTPHFDYVCEHTANGVAILNAKGEAPVIFGVLTVNDIEQARDRAGGKLGNKGSEAACTAIRMANLRLELDP